jgi:hypothetical protein
LTISLEPVYFENQCFYLTLPMSPLKKAGWKKSPFKNLSISFRRWAYLSETVFFEMRVENSSSGWRSSILVRCFWLFH